MRVVAVITAREKSLRLPNKWSADICGKPMLQRVYNRAKMALLLDDIIIATTDESSRIIRYCKKHHIKYDAGKENDILGSLYSCGRKTKADVIVRVWGDSPLLEPKVIDWGIRIFGQQRRCDYLNTENFPPGTLIGVVPFSLIKKHNLTITNPEHRQWYTKYILDNVGTLDVCCMEYEIDLTNTDIAVDDQAGLEFARRVYSKYGNNFTLGDCICMK